MTADRTPTRRHMMRLLDLASISVLTTAIVVWVWPVSVPKIQVRSAPDAVATAPVRTANGLADSGTSRGLSADSLINLVIDGNVFSATRQAPRTRFVVSGREPVASANVMQGTMEPAPVDSATAGTERYPLLSGIVMASGERRALLQLTAADGAPRLYRVGEVHAGYRVVRIDSRLVVLSSQTGTRTVRLSPRATPDSLEMMP